MTHGAQEGGSSLPNEPLLTEAFAGKSCVVHYTLTGIHAAPDLSFVKVLAKSIDGAVKKFAKSGFQKPFFERDVDDKELLHIYVMDTSTVDGFDDAVLGFVNPTDDVEGKGNEKAQTVYMVIDHDLKTLSAAAGTSWKKQLKSTVFHEYFHCVQLARNAYMASWGLEGQAVWAEKRWGRVDTDLFAFLERDDSLVNRPELPIWDDSLHKYSTSPLWAYLEQRVGKHALVSFWEVGAESNDPINVLESVLFIENFDFFDDFWIDFAGRLVAKDIKGLSKKKLPDVKLEAKVANLGWETTGQIVKTGIVAYEIAAPSSQKTKLLFVRLTAGMTGTPTGILIHDKNHRLQVNPGFWNDVDKFKKPKKAILVITDGAYEFPDTDKTDYTAEAFAPYLKIKEVDFGDPLGQGENATITFKYDLLFTPPGPTLPVTIYRKLKGKKFGQELQSSFNWPVGSGQETTLNVFVPGFPPLKSLSVQINVKVPGDGFGGAHIVSKHKGKLKILSND
ncbi:MAG: hypothetical protein DRQ55_06425 [Planctomycetota bacterium]|nr:MAG: hypothetical protein DRQ55_06425 [Planctomycetota bacterium]